MSDDKVQEGDMFMLIAPLVPHRLGHIYIVVNRLDHDRQDGWETFNLTRQQYECDFDDFMLNPKLYRRLA
jgi:hypothetical protein